MQLTRKMLQEIKAEAEHLAKGNAHWSRACLTLADAAHVLEILLVEHDDLMTAEQELVEFAFKE